MSGERRVPQLPDAPTFREAGFGDLDMGAWYALLAPANTPPQIVDKLNATVAAILSDVDFVEKNLTSQGMLPLQATPAQFASMIESATAETAAYIKRSGAKID